MSLWGAAPVLVIALLGGAGHPGLAHANDRSPTIHSPAGLSASLVAHWAPGAVGQPPGTPSTGLASTSAALDQVGAGTWQTTVLLNNVGTSCPTDKASYLLETSRPDQVFPATSVVPVMTGSDSTSQCVAVTVTFSGLPQAPEGAALEFGAGGASPSSVQLTVSRNVTLFEYLAIPVIAGLAMVALLMLLILSSVRIYSWDGSRIRPFGADTSSRRWKKFKPNVDFWDRTVFATGAWTVNDSWATNIGTAVGVLTVVLTTTTATNSLFPGVALDRFSLVNVTAGAIVTAVPLAFGILYARWIDRYRGITTDSLIAATMKLPDRCEVQPLARTRVTYRPKRAGLLRWLVQDQPIDLSPQDRLTLVALPHHDNRCLATGHSQLRLSESAHVILLAGTAVTQSGRPNGAKALHTSLREVLEVRLAEGTRIVREFSPWMRIAAGATADVGDGTEVPQGLTAGQPITLPDGAIAKLKEVRDSASAAIVNRAGLEVTLLGGKETRAILCRGVGDPPAGTEIALPSGMDAKVCDPPGGVAAASAQPTVAEVAAPAGGVLTVPGGAIIGPGSEPERWSTLLKDGGKIDIPPQSAIKIRTYPGGVLALPGGSDMVVSRESYFEITGGAGALVVAGDDLAPPPNAGASPQEQCHAPHRPADGPGKDGQSDANLEFPVCGIGPAGVKISVTGTAEIKFSAHMALTTPRGQDSTFKDERRVIIPQAGGALVANMRLVIIAALITMFGVGAEVGVAGTLAFLSDAITAWQWVIVCLIATVAVFTVYYGATAIRALADPQPGSSLSGTSGNSFTL